ncbi:MAG TPA: hypothetical protein VL485_24100 [Ktedonobacteraceae bacterium]|nr:hypothetical protein [Ktedonobacteraceae bacterium]
MPGNSSDPSGSAGMAISRTCVLVLRGRDEGHSSLHIHPNLRSQRNRASSQAQFRYRSTVPLLELS